MWNFVLKNSQKKVSKWGVWYFKSGGLGGFGGWFFGGPGGVGGYPRPIPEPEQLSRNIGFPKIQKYY